MTGTTTFGLFSAAGDDAPVPGFWVEEPGEARGADDEGVTEVSDAGSEGWVVGGCDTVEFVLLSVVERPWA